MWWTERTEAALLFATAALGVWLATVAFRRRAVAGGPAFGWLILSVAAWCFLSGLHRVLASIDVRILTSRFQYIAIVSTGPLWFFFCRAYAQRPVTHPGRDLALWIHPALTVLAAFTNDWHGALWPDVRPDTNDPGGRLIYDHGPWFWFAAAYEYVLVAAGTWFIVRSLMTRPPQYRGQAAALAIAVSIPWVSNALYLLDLTPDLTPLAFGASGGCFAWGVFRHHLLDLVPIARDMLFDRFRDSVFVLDPGYRVLDMNASARAMSGGHTRLGQPIEELVPWWTSLISGATRQADGQSVIHVGDRALDVAVTPASDEQGRLMGWLVVVHDITERLRSESQRRTLDRRLQDQQHSESLTVLAGGLAHDFNNLLAGIMGNADLLAMRLPPQDAELKDMVGTITIGAERAADLVAKMLAYAGEGAGPAGKFEIDELVREMVDLLKVSVARHCRLVYDSPGALPPIHGDPTQIRQVILNLIVNAAESIERTDSGHEDGLVRVRTGVETLTGAAAPLTPLGVSLASGAYVFVEVQDTGLGMSPDMLARIFDPFFTTKTTGRGLGLASVQGIVRSHRGAVNVTSSPGEGTTFRVWLPAA